MNLSCVQFAEVLTSFSMSDTVKPVKASGDAPELNQDPRRLKRARMEAGLTIRQASEKSGLSIGIISLLERGVHSARVTTLVSLAQAYGREIGELMPPEAIAATEKAA